MAPDCSAEKTWSWAGRQGAGRLLPWDQRGLRFRHMCFWDRDHEEPEAGVGGIAGLRVPPPTSQQKTGALLPADIKPGQVPASYVPSPEAGEHRHPLPGCRAAQRSEAADPDVGGPPGASGLLPPLSPSQGPAHRHSHLRAPSQGLPTSEEMHHESQSQVKKSGTHGWRGCREQQRWAALGPGVRGCTRESRTCCQKEEAFKEERLGERLGGRLGGI